MAEIEYFYSAHSSFAYLGSARFMEIAIVAGRSIVHKPMNLSRVVVEAGAGAFAGRGAAHQAYYFGREKERWSQWRNEPIVKGYPPNHRGDMALCNGMLIAALRQGHNIDQLAHEMLQAHWRDNADLTDAEALARAARAAGFEPDPLLDDALSPEVQAVYLANTEEAIDRSVFGSPTYFIDGDMFYGQDRLEMVERALKQPFNGAWPRPETP